MKQTILGKTALAVSVFACAGMLSFERSEQKGVSLSIERAQAQMDEPASPGITTRRSARRAGRATAMGAGAAAVGAGVAAGATAAYYAGGGPTYGAGGPYYTGNGPYAYYGGNGPYAGSGPSYTGNAYAYYGGPGVWSQDYAARNGIICQPGTLIRLEDGLMHRCQ
ncbi:hypothetical protein [Bradyrhizobium sp. CB3481]|uniref:hypothetical protein n=1 Tax=Bradyrhizobium sp. CB3481 TaxID=3039158 RepID=UPI0024B0D9D3|nr:hypothetical protein [Bradyrhizobium sp. CB3481]WFU15935.1 hypothetical protein QA643_34065 [Bradyrhizobium sp. CB3481]